MKVEIKCVHCKSKEYVKVGFRKTLKRGKIQRYQCLKCNKLFTNDEGFYRMKNKESIITMSIDMYLSNLSSRKMRNQLRRHLETSISHVSVLDWVRKYVKKVSSYVDKLQPKLNGRVYADETAIRRGKKDDWFWCAVDWDSRMIVGTHYSLTHNTEDAKDFFRKVRIKVNPKYVKTDSAPFYPKAMRNVFSSAKNPNFMGIKRTVHKVNNVYKTGKHNVRIETVFSKIKDRVDDFRGFKALWSAPILMAGLIIQHNFIEQHTTVKDYPCERAGLRLGLENNRWLDLIKLAIA